MPEAPDNGLVLLQQFNCKKWSFCELKSWNHRELGNSLKCLGKDCWTDPPTVKTRQTYKYALQSCVEGYSMYYDNDALAHCFIGEDTQSAGAGEQNTIENESTELETGCYGLIWCRWDGTWSTSFTCLPISVASSTTTGTPPPTSSAGVTTGSSSGAISTTQTTSTVTGSPKTTGPLSTSFAGVTTSSSLAATSSVRTTNTVTGSLKTTGPLSTSFNGVTAGSSLAATSTVVSTNTVTVSPTTKGPLSTSFAGVTTGSSLAATSKVRTTNTVTGSLKTTGPLSTSFAGVTAGSSLAATSTVRTTNTLTVSPTTTGPLSTSFTGVTTGSSLAATSTVGTTNTVTVSPKTRASSSTTFADVAIGSRLAATNTAVTTSADTSRLAGSTTGYAGFSTELRTAFPGGVKTSVSSGETSTWADMSSTANALTTATTISHSMLSSATTGTEASTSSSISDGTLSTKIFAASRTTASSIPTATSARNMTTFTPVPLTSTSQGASSVQTTISHSTPLTIREKNNATKSFPTTAGHTWSASTMPKTPTKQESDRIDSMTSIQQFVQTTVSTGTFSNTKDVQKMKTLGNTSGATTVVDTQKTPLLTTVSTHSPTGQQPSLYLKSSKTSSAKASTTMKSTVDNTLGLHKSRQSTTKMFNTPASLTAIIDDMTTATTSPTKPTTLFKTSPHENTTSTQKSQGRHKQLAEHDDKPSDEMIGYIALVSGIAGAVGIAVLLPLIVFGLKSLCTAAKVAPDAGLFESSAENYAVNGNEGTTSMLAYV